MRLNDCNGNATVRAPRRAPVFRGPTLASAAEADAYLSALEASNSREPLRTIPLLLARCAGSAPHLIGAHPTSRDGLAEFRRACRALWPSMPAPTRGEVKEAVQYLRRRKLAPPWWVRTPLGYPHTGIAAEVTR